MKASLLKNRLWIIVTGVLLFSVFHVSAQPTCIVGGTNFDVGEWYLCDPELTSDADPATGWLNSTLTNVVNNNSLNSYCGAVGAAGAADRHLPIEYAQHRSDGLQNNSMTTNEGEYPFSMWAQSQYSIPAGFRKPGSTAIFANPRMVHPYLTNRPGDNILINMGSDQDVPFFTYTVNGLVPGSQATFTGQAFSLLSNWAHLYYLSRGFFTYSGGIDGGFLGYGPSNTSGGISGNSPSVRVGHALSGITVTGGTTQAITFGNSVNVTWTGTVDANGSITFYVARGNASYRVPIGLDNVVIRGTPNPKPIYLGEPCVKMPLVVNLESVYPSGTIYSWTETVTGATGTSSGFIFEPALADVEYKIKASVTMPGAGCAAATSAEYIIKSKACCEDDNGNPMAKINIFHDDFGHFPNINTYQYRDEYGNLHALPTKFFHCGGGSLCGPGDVPYVYPQLINATDLGIRLVSGDLYQAALYNGGAALSFRQPYYPGVTQDHTSADGKGGMLYFSIGSAGRSDVILYKKKVDGLCQGKKIYFSAWFAPINRGVSADGYPNKVGELVLEVLNASNGAVLFSTGNVVILGNAGWRPAGPTEFTMPSGVTSVYLQVRHIGWSRCGDNDVCDYAIDDIIFQVCAPPNVAMDATVKGNASMTDLCDGNDITLTVETSAVIEDTYPDIGYLFQYTKTNPQTNPSAVWIDMAPIGSSKQFVIVDPPSHPIFSGLRNGDKIYFRAVVGDKTYLLNERAEWISMDPLSPCRAISISMFLIEASLNCKICTEPKNIIISSSAAAPVVNDIKTVNLCTGGSTVLNTNEINPDTEVYSDYTITWYRGNRTTPVGTAANPGIKANPLTVNYADATAAGVKYYVQVIDRAFPLSLSCHKWDSILVISNPVPTVDAVTNKTFCAGDPSGAINFSSPVTSATFAWSNNNTAIGLAASGTGNIASFTATNSGTTAISGTITVTPSANGCAGTPTSFTITVNPTNTVSAASSSPTVCINTALSPSITHTTTGATGIGTATGLPTGVTAAYAGNTITISGTPTVTGTFNYSIPLTGGCGTINATGTITVITANTVSPPEDAQTVCINTPLTSTHTTTGATGIGTPTGLPTGVTASHAGNKITISGTPTVSGTFPYTIPLTGGCGTVNAIGSIRVNPANTASVASSSPTVCINTALTPSITHTTTGATGIGTATGLPAGVNAQWAGNTITISGTPTVDGTFNYTIPLTGGCGTVSATGTITVTAANTVSAPSPASSTVCINNALTPSITHTTTGATGIGTPTGLPAGVNAQWAGNTITISGTPTASGTFNYSIPLTGGCGTVNATGTITVITANTVSPASSTPTVCINTAINPTITHTTGGATGIGTPTGLPAGVTAAWASNTITISGTPTATGTFAYTIPLTGGCGTVSATGTITVTPNMTVGTPSSTLTVCINTAITPITHITTDATGIGTATGLPAGVNAAYAGNTITISGTPTASGTFAYTIPLTGGCGTVNATGTITVTPDMTVSTASSTPTLCINTVLTPITHTTSDATGIGTVTGLPAGVTAGWAGNTITISGTPTASGTFTYTIPLTGGCGTVNATGTITITPDMTVGAASASPTLCINTVLTPITHTTTGATGIGTATGLPAGVTAGWAGNTITISGTPTATGTFAYTIPLTGGCGTVNATGTITVTTDMTVGTASSSPTVCINTALTPVTHTTTNATGIGTATGLPTGVTASFAGNTITISGTPTVDGTFNYTIPLTGGCGTINATGTITVITANTVSAASSTPTVCINTALTPVTHTTTGATGIGTATGLPAGVNAQWAGNTITISGTPTVDGTFTYTIPLTGGCGTVNATGTITVTPDMTVGTASSTPTLCINTALTPITHTTTGATGTGPASGLPTGVIALLTGNTITISGTPTVDGTFNYTIPLTGSCGNVNATGTITVTAANTVSAASSTPTVCINTALTAITHTTTGATDIGTASGLPTGVTAAFSGNTITISGTPTVNGTFNYTIPLTGGCGTINATGTITVITSNTVSPASSTPTVCINTALTPITHITAGATGIGTATGLPTGVTAAFAGNTITISGTPTVDGTFTYTIPLTGGCGTIEATGTITVAINNTVSAASDSPTLCISSTLTPITHTTTGATGIGTATGLPAGVNAAFAGNTITISGMPTASGTFNYTIPLTGGCGTVNATGTITVTAANTVNAASSSPTVCINTALTPITHATTGATGIGTASGLPAGVNAAFAGNTITISGTPTASGTFNYTIPLTGGCSTVSATGTITVAANNTVNPASSSPTLCINTALTPITHATTGATGIGAASGLPAGVTAAFAGNTITISGTPTASGTFNYTIPLAGGCGTVNATGTITVTAANTVNAASSTQTLCTNTALTPITHATTGATGIGTPTGLPAGVTASFAGNTITISGTPTASGTFNYTIPLTGGCGAINATGTITVTAGNTIGAASSAPTLCINTALTPITHATTGATGIGTATGLPAGVNAQWAGNTITISGTPTASGFFTYTIPLTGGCGIVSATGTITVTTNMTVGTASSAPLCANTALTPITHTTTGATGIGTPTGLPAGVTAAYASNTITISGTPTASGIFNYTIPLAGGCGNVNATGTIVVNQLPTLTETPAVQVVCEDKTVVLSVKPTSSSANVTWYDEQNAIVGTGTEISVNPPYKKSGSSYQSTYYHKVILEDGCEASFSVPVKIDEALNGSLKDVETICEGNSIRLDASSYEADTYVWTLPNLTQKFGAIQTEYPSQTSTYYVDIQRGACHEETSITVEVNGKPVILSIDSVGVRDREIRREPGTGTPPFKFGVDNQPVTDDPVKYNLLFGLHSFYIIDEAGCRSDAADRLVDAPKLFIPSYFSPNGDGINDTWDIPGMKEIYPNAVVTIYDRFGKQLIQYSGSDPGWDGTYLGRDMPTTDYWYIIDIDEINKQYVGHFTLLRK